MAAPTSSAMAARRLVLLTVLLPLVGAIASLRGLQTTQYSAGGGEDYTIKFVVQLDASWEVHSLYAPKYVALCWASRHWPKSDTL